MEKSEKLNKFIIDAQNFIGHQLTSSDSRFIAWNHSLLRFINSNYDKATYDLFNDRSYSLSICTFNTPKSTFIRAFEADLQTTIEDLKMLLEEETESKNEIIGKEKNDNDSIQIILNIFSKFHTICRQLRNRYDSRETLDVIDEYDTQDLLHALLCLYFEDIRAEEWTPSYAGSGSRQDFLLKTEQIVIEVKKTRKGLGNKQVGEQLIIDIERYKVHPDCKTLLCFIYDPDERIINPKGIENDLTKISDNLNVITKIIQK